MLRLNENTSRLADNIGSGFGNVHSGNWWWGDPFAYFFDWVDDYIVRSASDSANLTATTSQVFSCWLKQNADGTAASSSLPFFGLPYMYGHIRNSTNDLTLRFADAWWAKTSTYTLWTWFRDKVHVICCLENNWWWVYTTKLYVNWILRDSDTWAAPPNTLQSATPRVWSNSSSGWFFSGCIRDARAYTGIISDADALAIYNLWEPATAVKYFQRWPVDNESWSSTIDKSWNSRIWTLTNWVIRQFIF